MVNEIRITNVETLESLVINKDGTSDFVLDHISWDSPSVTVDTYRVPFQIGESISGVTVGKRSPVIVGYVTNKLPASSMLGRTWKEYYEEQEKIMEQRKMELDRIISVYQDIKIEANGYYLDARPSSPVVYSEDEKENNEIVCMFTINLVCCRPMFYKDNVTVSLATVEDQFHFPLVIPEEQGVVFGRIMRRQSVVIQNEGDVDASCTIVIRANGGQVEDPRIYNVVTGEYIEFSGVTIEDGDYITITSETGEENAIMHKIKDSSETSLVGYVLDGSKYLKIKRGTGYYAYQVEEQQQNNVEITITYTPQFFNIRGM